MTDTTETAPDPQHDDVEQDPLTVEIVTMPWAQVTILEQNQNARYMRHETFQQLVRNIRKDGVPTQLPLVWFDDDSGRSCQELADAGVMPLCLSGNHRTEATLEALGPNYAGPLMATRDPLEPARRLGIQLSHNSIAGEDNMAILRDLYDSIDDVDWRQYAGLDDKTLNLLQDVDLAGLSEANLDFQTLTVTFLPSELERAKKAFAEASAFARGNERWLTTIEHWDRLLDSLDTAGKSAGISNQAASMAVMLDVFDAHVSDLAELWTTDDGLPARGDKTWVPMATITGYDVPGSAGAVIRQAIKRLQSREDIEHPWQALEMICADYLAGQ